MADDSPTDIPSANAFATQLVAQVLGDLDGIVDDDGHPSTDARQLLLNAAATGATRAAVLVVLMRGALAAYPSLLGEAETAVEPDDNDALAAVVTLEPRAAAHGEALLAAAGRLTRYVSASEPGRPPLWQSLAEAVDRLYGGMRDGDERRSHHGLIELRSRAAHLDACAGALAADATLTPWRVVRPDRFHDLYIGYLQTASSGDEVQQPVATLRQDGRLAAVVTETAHPVAAAEDALRNQLGEDGELADAALARVRALIVFLDTLRRSPAPELQLDLAAQPPLALVIAAATAPLRSNGRFVPGELAALARFNQRLLTPPARAVH